VASVEHYHEPLPRDPSGAFFEASQNEPCRTPDCAFAKVVRRHTCECEAETAPLAVQQG
jgi:hypothetical protein